MIYFHLQDRESQVPQFSKDLHCSCEKMSTHSIWFFPIVQVTALKIGIGKMRKQASKSYSTKV